MHTLLTKMSFVSVSLDKYTRIVSQIFYALLSLLLLILVFIKIRRRNRGGARKRAPEASGGWPLIGHLHLLAVDVPPFRILGDMADKYGPIFYIRLGRKPTLVVSSWEIVKECFGTNDKVFLDRPYVAAINQAYGGAMFGLGPSFGQYWHNMRRISNQKLLSNTRLDLLKNVRSSEVKTFVNHLFSLCHSGPTKVDMSEVTSILIINIMTKMVAGKSFSFDKDVDVEGRVFVKSMNEFMKLIGTFVVSDVVPFTEWMDLQGHFKNVKRTVEECDRVIDRWLQEHVRKRKEEKVKENYKDRDFIDVMLSLLDDDPCLSYPHSPEMAIKSTVMNVIIGGAETTSVGTIWALSHLVNNPKVLKKVQIELDTHVGKQRWMQESDIKNLTYLNAVIKETMRLVVPLGVPRESTKDCTIANYHIPKGTTLLVNIWKIHQDPRVWSDPNKFKPERFLSNTNMDTDTDEKFKFIPFSAGRKSCPGMALAMQMLPLVIGRVLQGFDLSTPDGQKVDVTEGLGLTNPKATPLELILTPRLSHELYMFK